MSTSDIIQLLQGFMQASGTSQGSLAAQAGVTRAAVNEILNGKRVPGMDTMESILGVFGYTMTATQSGDLSAVPAASKLRKPAKANKKKNATPRVKAKAGR